MILIGLRNKDHLRLLSLDIVLLEGDGITPPSVQEVTSWDYLQLVGWFRKHEFPQLQTDDIDLLEKNHISGEVFLLQDADFFKACKLALGPAIWLTML